ncbi:hypothetical protein BKA70DRAFT_1250318 [Coprinopsis sp. MPI-PUGE-AT-0042]|nr:hypothetical protein BKA70DRAFT_1250318 [Coprinopsis sp. MPI-PUGE-AT-0042]
MASRAVQGLPSSVEDLKTRGNELYAQEKYDDAYNVYSAALARDENNAILWANRGAASMAKKSYRNAVADLKTSVGLNPAYEKGSDICSSCKSLKDWQESVAAWRRALDCLPEDSAADSPAEEARRRVYEEVSPEGVQSKPERKGPWDSAEALKNVIMPLTARGGLTSVYSMNDAYAQWKKGVDLLKALGVTHQGPFKTRYGRLGTIEALTGRIQNDERVFHVPANIRDFSSTIMRQMIWERDTRNGYPDTVQVADLKVATLHRLQEESWDSVRPAISITIRVGIGEWSDVQPTVRGGVLSRSFIRGIKRLRLQLMFKNGAPTAFTRDDLKEAADDLIADVDTDPKLPDMVQYRAGHHNSYWKRPKGIALSVLAWVAAQVAYDLGPQEEQPFLLRQASKIYLMAAESIPEDDEHHAYLLRQVLVLHCKAGATLRETLPIFRLLRAIIPEILPIWKTTELGRLLPQWYRSLEEFIAECEGRDLDEIASLPQGLDLPSKRKKPKAL